jgi:hypothetical protein
MTLDRVETHSFALAKDFLAQMLGVPVAEIPTITMSLEHLGLIRYEGSHLTILDREGLQRRACECYWVIRREYDGLVEQFTT